MDLTFKTPYGRFNYRVGAIILHDGKVLLMRNPEVPYLYSVGVDEEVTGEHFHDVAVYFLMKDTAALGDIKCSSVTERGVSEELIWIPLEELEQHYVVPVSIARELKNLPEHLTPIVERD